MLDNTSDLLAYIGSGTVDQHYLLGGTVALGLGVNEMEQGAWQGQFLNIMRQAIPLL